MTSWYLHVDGSTSGPHPAEHVRHWLDNRQLPDTSLFWPDGGAAWITVPEAWRALRLAPGATPAATHPEQTGQLAAVTDHGDGTPAHHAAHSGQGTHVADAAHTGQLHHAALTSRSPVQAVTARLADFAGVERISGFRLGELLSLSLRNHTRDEVEEYFGTGLRGLTPPLNEVESNWPKPWMFVRLYVAASLLFLVFLGMFKIFTNSNLLPGMILIGSFMVPVTIVVFFFEANTPRNVSLYLVGRAFFAGGVLSLAITLILVQVGVANTPVLGRLDAAGDGWTAAFTTGLVEELGKLLAVYVIAMGLPGQRYPWILNGMLFGATVGAGFAAFESAGYALNALLDTRDVDAAVNVILLRGALAPFGHVVWAALVGGALWRVKRDRHVTPAMLVNSRVLRMLLFTVGMHALWNSPIDLPFMLKYIGLGLLAWLLVLGMITSGLKQIKATQAAAAGGGSSLPQPTALQPVVPPVGRS